jgi:hypothetical protein
MYFVSAEDTQNEEESHDTSGKTEYKKICATLNVVPCSYFLANIEDQTLTLRYHQFSSDDVRAIAKPLWVNRNFRLHLIIGRKAETNLFLFL